MGGRGEGGRGRRKRGTLQAPATGILVGEGGDGEGGGRYVT